MFINRIAELELLENRFQRVWDRTLKDSQIMLVLCSSYIGMMDAAVLGYQAPIYGRRTGQYLLEPLQFRDAGLRAIRPIKASFDLVRIRVEPASE